MGLSVEYSPFSCSGTVVHAEETTMARDAKLMSLFNRFISCSLIFEESDLEMQRRAFVAEKIQPSLHGYYQH
jgi:hypothetical protein